MPIPDYQTLMLLVLRLAAEGERRVMEATGLVADEFGLSEEEREELLPSGRQRVLHNRFHWAKFYLSKAGLVEQPRRGVFTASAEGRTLLARNPARIDNQFLLTYPAFKDFYRGGGNAPDIRDMASSPTDDARTPEEVIDEAYLSVRDALREELLARILDNSPSFFEHLIVDLLVALGYGGTHRNAAQQLGRSGDGGVDGVINKDRLGLDRVYVQAKRYDPKNAIGRPDVQGFVGSLVGHSATKGVFVTTSSFSQHAIQYAENLPQRVVLIDGDRLADLMIEHDVGVRLSRAVELKRLDEDFFDEGA